MKKMKPVPFLLRIVAAVLVVHLMGVAAKAMADDPVTLKVVKVDSQELAGENGSGTNAVDGDPATIWHTQWQDESPAPPHEIIISLSRPCRIAGFTYLPRQDESDHGLIKDYEFYVSDDGKDFGPPVKKGRFAPGREKQVVRFDAKQCGFIKLKALSEINDLEFTSAAEIGIVPEEKKSAEEGKPKGAAPKLKVIKVDSQELAGENGSGTNAVDGDPATIWHTEWQDASPEPPHEIIIELTPAAKIKGFTYLPRQDEEVNGTILDYEFYVSADGKDFGKPVKKGTFADSKQKKTVTFDAIDCHFFKLRALSEINGAAWTSAAEIGVVTE
jgi:hypothetical protein